MAKGYVRICAGWPSLCQSTVWYIQHAQAVAAPQASHPPSLAGLARADADLARLLLETLRSGPATLAQCALNIDTKRSLKDVHSVRGALVDDPCTNVAHAALLPTDAAGDQLEGARQWLHSKGKPATGSVAPLHVLALKCTGCRSTIGSAKRGLCSDCAAKGTQRTPGQASATKRAKDTSTAGHPQHVGAPAGPGEGVDSKNPPVAAACASGDAQAALVATKLNAGKIAAQQVQIDSLSERQQLAEAEQAMHGAAIAGLQGQDLAQRLSHTSGLQSEHGAQGQKVRLVKIYVFVAGRRGSMRVFAAARLDRLHQSVL